MVVVFYVDGEADGVLLVISPEVVMLFSSHHDAVAVQVLKNVT